MHSPNSTPTITFWNFYNSNDNRCIRIVQDANFSSECFQVTLLFSVLIISSLSCLFLPSSHFSQLLVKNTRAELKRSWTFDCSLCPKMWLAWCFNVEHISLHKEVWVIASLPWVITLFHGFPHFHFIRYGKVPGSV